MDDGAPKRTGVSLIIKKNTIGKHIYKNTTLKGRAINLRLKLKGKIDISISSIYGPANHSDKKAKNRLSTLSSKTSSHHSANTISSLGTSTKILTTTTIV